MLEEHGFNKQMIPEMVKNGTSVLRYKYIAHIIKCYKLMVFICIFDNGFTCVSGKVVNIFFKNYMMKTYHCWYFLLELEVQVFRYYYDHSKS